VVIGLVAALFFVDFISGMLHWAADTWGKFETPIFGPGIIRSFRMHHVNPQDITKHSFV
jgi:ubiquitin-conjugating enzyme E2 variant